MPRWRYESRRPARPSYSPGCPDSRRRKPVGRLAGAISEPVGAQANPGRVDPASRDRATPCARPGLGSETSSRPRARWRTSPAPAPAARHARPPGPLPRTRARPARTAADIAQPGDRSRGSPAERRLSARQSATSVARPWQRRGRQPPSGPRSGRTPHSCARGDRARCGPLRARHWRGRPGARARARRARPTPLPAVTTSNRPAAAERVARSISSSSSIDSASLSRRRPTRSTNEASMACPTCSEEQTASQ